MSPLRTRLLRVLVAIAALALVLAVFEGVARIALPPPQRVEILDADVARRLATENDAPLGVAIERKHVGATWGGRTLYVATRTGARLRANTVAAIHDHRLSGLDTIVETNSLGWRNREIGLKTRPRVLFLGDSITLGDWLPEEQTFVRRVETLSGDGAGSIETINAGIGAVGLETELAILLETGLSVEPDVVVVGFYLNDAEPSRGVHVAPPPEALRWSRLAEYAWRAASVAFGDDDTPTAVQQRRAEERDWRRRLDDAARDQAAWEAEIRADFPPGGGDPLREASGFNRIIGKSAKSWGRAWSASSWDRLAPLFRELARQAELHDFTLLIVAFPVKLQVEAEFVYDYPQRRLREITDEIGAPLLDLLPVLRALHRDGREQIFYDQCHHTAFGNDRIARAILDFVREEGRLGQRE